MLIPTLATLLRAAWMIIEVPYLRPFRVKPRRNWDRRSAQVWDFANGLEVVGMVLGFIGFGRIYMASNVIAPLGLSLMVAGIAIRWTAIFTLGKYFTCTVLIKDDHRLIRAGVYKHLRHPAYTGALIAHVGLGLSFSNWFSLALSSVPHLVAVMYRIQVEEQALSEAFGEQYRDYAKGTKRLIPKLY